MDAFLASTLAVAIAEVGDKTQLLSLFLAARYSKHLPVVLGITVATLLNHALSAWLGVWIALLIPAAWLPWVLAVSFITIAGWLLIPDKDGCDDSAFLGLGAFMATTILFFLAEIGDKTQIATVVLAARYADTFWVIIGTTAGMLIANIPVIMAGRWLMDRIPLVQVRIGASGLYITMAVITLWAAFMNS